MNNNLLSKREYKQLKREVIEETAIGVGYYNDIMNKIPEYALFDAIRELSEYGWIKENTDDATLRNMLVTEAIRKMGYQDFKEVAPYLFSFPVEQKREYFRVQPIQISRKEYEFFQKNLDELMMLKTDIKQLNQSLDEKIAELETTRVDTGDKVIGINPNDNTILLLRRPENAYIDDWEAKRDNLITDYCSNDSNAKQTVEYLLNNYPTVKPIIAEYVMNNDLYRGFADVPKNSIDELHADNVPDFNTHYDFYNFASNYQSFEERYPTFEQYVVDRYDFIYQYTPHEYLNYAEDILKDRLTDINVHLDSYDKELMIHEVVGYSQGEEWELSYLKDNAEDSQEVYHYLEHEIGAWYRGSLAEVVSIPLDSITQDKGYDGTVNQKRLVDTELLHRGNELSDLLTIYPELQNYQTIELFEKENQKQQVNSPSLSL